MITTAQAALAVGDSVYLAHDPGQEHGVIVAATENKSQWLVTWRRGKTWIHPSADLVPVES